MILEGLVTTLARDGAMNVAPMGPEVEDDDTALGRFRLRPFKATTTYRNLMDHPEGVLHVTDDALLLARAAIGAVDASGLSVRAASAVRGAVLASCCRYHEFRIVGNEGEDRGGLRAVLVGETVASGRFRDFFGFNRAKHAVVEAAILATRVGIVPIGEIRDELKRLSVPVDKTGGAAERAALELLKGHVERAAVGLERGLRTEGASS
jgi:hypothetical protein